MGFGVATAMMLHSGQGAMPWAVLDQGIVDRTGLAYGWVVLGVGLLVMLAWIPLRQKPGIGTIANIIVISLVIDPGPVGAGTAAARAGTSGGDRV